MRRSKTIVIVAAVAVVAIGGLLAATVVIDGESGPSDSDKTTPPQQGDSSPEQEPISDDSGGDGGQANQTDNSEGREDNSTETGELVDESEQNSSENETNQVTELASITVTTTVADLGPAETGNVVLYNLSSDRSMGIHEFENGNTHTFEDLPPGHTYKLEAATETAPPETVFVSPEAGEQVKRKIELGYEMNGASTFEAAWFQIYEDGTTLEDGYTALDPDGNYLVSWEDPDAPERWKNLYIDKNGGRYTNAGENDWYVDRRDYKINESFATHVPRRGLAEIKNRTYLGEAPDPRGNGTVHEYEMGVTPEIFGNEAPAKIKIDPETGHVVYVRIDVDKLEDTTVEDYGWTIINHGSGDIEAIPDGFPVENPPEE